MVDWRPYLESLGTTYAQWWQVYTITDVVGRTPQNRKQTSVLFDFKLMVQTVEPDRDARGQKAEQVEKLTVLEGLRKYAPQHILLVGRPGSGKSTALVRLLLEEAEKGKEACRDVACNVWEQGERSIKIPVLVELRYYRTTIEDLIQQFLQRHDPNLTLNPDTLKAGLRQRQFLLLLDGINELPSEAARRELQQFRQNYQKTTPMVFTTRDLGIGGNLGITKKLEMQPLTPKQMEEFVCAYLPQQGKQMLPQLGNRLRELGQTPLLLKMLCDLFHCLETIPSNLGSVFRAFAQQYDRKVKADVPVTEDSREFWSELLQYLAFVMTKGNHPKEIQVAIAKTEAETIFTEYLRQHDFLDPPVRARKWLNDLLKHHLIQLRANNQIEFRHQLIQEYYTAEYLLKQLPSLSDEELQRQYLNYLKWTEPLALMLELVEDKAQAVRVVRLALAVDVQLGARLAGEVKPEFQEQTVALVSGLEIPQLLTIQLLGRTKSESAISNLMKALEHEDSDVSRRAADALGKIGLPKAIPHLIKALKHEDVGVSRRAADALGKIGSESAIPALIETLNERQVPNAREIAATALGKIGSDSAVPALVQTLKDKKSSSIRERYSIHEIYTRLGVDQRLEAFNSGEYYLREEVADALGKINSKSAELALIEALDDEDPEIRKSVAYTLAKIGSKRAVSACVKALNDDAHLDREDIFYTLAEMGYELLVTILTQSLTIENAFVRDIAAKALEEINDQSLTEADINDFYDEIDWNSNKAVYKLAASDDESESDLTSILEILRDDPDHRIDAAIRILGEIGNPDILPVLHDLLLDTAKSYIIDPISQIQNRCKFYNFTLTQPILTTPSPLMHILHLSDLHFTTLDQATLWSTQLRLDLRHELNISQLDALILSSDIANYSTPEEYEAAAQFLNTLCQTFSLNPEQITIVPGNHDLNWNLAQEAYLLVDRPKYNGKLIDGHYIKVTDEVIRVRDETAYKKRFENFRQFYKDIKRKPYPLDYDQQYTLDYLPEQNLLILGLNSAWQLDHHFKSRASIHENALSNALDEIDTNPDYDNCLKIAVWHHPLDSPYQDRIIDQDFIGLLAVSGFRFFLHGHIHKAETSLFRYDMSRDGRKLDRICAGTFGAPTKELVTATPWQYNLLIFEKDKLTVRTRCRRGKDAPWESDSIWRQGAGKSSLDYYTIEL
ncbi:MAG: HEAT repeat domain-containing protein [Coleofasciculus sp. G1-WW12-02]|uniref:HEAT repeat domain-containing protein n=1 Tax=Coleofasciculus sp. G1-WW12-02 TaxID=3068483 RepID=UPI0032F4D4A1